MSMRFFNKIWLGLPLGLLLSCNNAGSFKGNATQAAIPDPVPAAPATQEANAKQEVPENSLPKTETKDVAMKPPLPIPTTVETEVVAKACKQTLDYDPNEILCALVEEDSDTVWKNGKDVWVTGWLKNKRASWISPLAAQKDGTKDYCPFVPGSEKTIYVSNFELKADQEITIEAIMDDIGQLRLWKNADPNQEVYISNRNAVASGKIKLAKGFYTIVMDAVDVGAFASGAIATIFDGSGSMLRQTAASKDWCIYRVKVDVNIPEFLNGASRCRSCMIGDKAAAKFP
jgi:hypothetical protein